MTAPPEQKDRSYYERQVRQAVSTGQFLIAIELAREGLAAAEDSLALRQQLALALVQTGAIDAGRKELAKLVSTGACDEETLCLMGRVHKEIWRRAGDAAEKAAALAQVVRYYGEAFSRHRQYYGGVNLAYALALSGQRAEAERRAGEVAEICRRAAGDTEHCQDAWLLAAWGEAAVHLGDAASARGCYCRAASLFKGKWRDLSSMRRQARELLRARAEDERTFDDCFELPTVVTFVGHMLDRPTRPTPRFPPALEDPVRRRLLEHLRGLRAGFGYSFAACGGDILFCEGLLEQGAELHLILPFPLEVFKAQSVSYAGSSWESRLDQVVACAASVDVCNPAETTLAPGQAPSAVAYLFGNRITTGMARLQARTLDLELKTLALWDGRAGDGVGGTASVVAEWNELHLNPILINPSLFLEADSIGKARIRTGQSIPPPSPLGLNIQAMHQDIKAMLFADVVGYSRIGGTYVVPYVREFMRRVSRLIADSAHPPIIVNTWGDAFYLVFDTVGEGAWFALELRDLVGQTDWASLGLPTELSIRIALHAGPVYACVDPVIRQVTFTGSHVTQAARMEPVTAPGQVYVSQEFAALCAAEGCEGVAFEYLGRLPRAKKYGDAPLYRLDRDHAR